MYENKFTILVNVFYGCKKRNVYLHFLPNIGDLMSLKFEDDGIKDNFIVTKIEHDIQDTGYFIYNQTEDDQFHHINITVRKYI